MIERTEGHLTVPDGEQIWYETAGDGPPLVLAHGLGGNAAVWYQQLPHFARSYRVITWDQRGFGRSTNRQRKHGPASAVDDLLALLDHLDVERAAVVGQSMGGWAVLGGALRAPSRIAAVVLSCTTAGIPLTAGHTVDPHLVSGPQSARPLGMHPALGERLPTIDLARAYLYQALGTFGDRPGDAEFARLLGEHTYPATRLAALRQPVLMIAGELDGLMTPALIREASARLPNATVVEMPGRGHSPYFEDPDAWNGIVSDFLASSYAPLHQSGNS